MDEIKRAATAKRCWSVKVYYTPYRREGESDSWEVTLFRSRATTISSRRHPTLSEAVDEALETAERVHENENAKRQATRNWRAGKITYDEYCDLLKEVEG